MRTMRRKEHPREEPPVRRRDPAPSRWEYRAQRLLLTPSLRFMLRFGLPAVIVAGLTGAWLADADRRAAIAGTFHDLRHDFEQRPEFIVTTAQVEGCSDDLAAAVLDQLALDLPQSSFDLDLDAARTRIEALDAVKSADLRVRSGGTLQVVVTEREPAAVWRTEAGLMLIDEDGHRVAGLVARADRADLPLIAGRGAARAMPEALQILAAAHPLEPRIRGLVRMGQRRWDMVLDRDQRLFLPATDPVRALERFLALDHAQDILGRDLTAVDLRLADRPTLRLTAHALNEERRLRGLGPVETMP